MSSSQYYDNCPICGEDMLSVSQNDVYFPSIDTQCENCGFYTTTNVGIYDLKDFLDERFNFWYEEQEEDLTFDEYRIKFDKEIAPELKEKYEKYIKIYTENFK